MRITVALGPFIPIPPGAAGAVERRWLGTARTFARLGHDVTLVSRSEPGTTDGEVVEGVRHRYVKGFDQSNDIKRDLIKDAVFARRVLKALPEADILVTNSFWLPVLAGALRRRAGRIVVNVARFPKGQIKLYKAASAFAAPSSSVAQAIIEQTPEAEPRTVVVPNPIDVERFYPPDAHREPHDPPVVLYTGRLHREKGLELLINACATLSTDRPLRLRIVGPSAENRGGSGSGFVHELRALGEDHAGLDLCVEDPVYDRDALRELLWDCDVYAYPSCADQGESFGVAPLEAMACARPVVVSALPCFTDFVEHDKTGLVFDHHAHDATLRLADHIRALLNDPRRARELGQAASRIARTINYDTVADRYLSLFDTLNAETP